MNSYYGGALAALGGALVLGALPRTRARRAACAMPSLFAIGIAILANTRPVEGAVVSGAAILFLLAGFIRARAPWRAVVRSVVLPSALVSWPWRASPWATTTGACSAAR